MRGVGTPASPRVTALRRLCPATDAADPLRPDSPKPPTLADKKKSDKEQVCIGSPGPQQGRRVARRGSGKGGFIVHKSNAIARVKHWRGSSAATHTQMGRVCMCAAQRVRAARAEAARQVRGCSCAQAGRRGSPARRRRDALARDGAPSPRRPPAPALSQPMAVFGWAASLPRVGHRAAASDEEAKTQRAAA